jgi:hypothetical protein
MKPQAKQYDSRKGRWIYDAAKTPLQRLPALKSAACIQGGGTGYTIPRRSDKTRIGPLNRALNKHLNYIGCLFNRLKQLRCIVTRYEKSGGQLLGYDHFCLYHALVIICKYTLAEGVSAIIETLRFHSRSRQSDLHARRSYGEPT